ncbi:MAG: hypothetical protein ACRDJ9_25185 [Dehalococcoidia bacterium]
MSNLLKKYRNHRHTVRQSRELERAIALAPSRNVRDELLLAAQRMTSH